MTDQESAYQIGSHPPVNHAEFVLSRATAIQAYANIESALCTLFSRLLGIAEDTAGVVFYRITNARYRNKILQELQEKRCGDTHAKFWNSFESFVRRLDQRRNEIVHWHVVQDLDLSKPHPEVASWNLRPPAGWLLGSPAVISDKEMVEFIQQCEFISRLTNMFGMIIVQGKGSEDSRAPWLKIFQQPIVYPPPEGHPLYPRPKEPSPRPQSSGA